MTNEELQANLKQFEEHLGKLNKIKPILEENPDILAMWFGQTTRDNEGIQFLLAKLRAIRELLDKRRTELIGHDAADRFASDVEAILDQKSAPE
jgi:hypothetical protein